MIMNSIEQLNILYLTFIKPDPFPLKPDTLSYFLDILESRPLLSLVIKLLDNDLTREQREARELIKKWNTRLLNIVLDQGDVLSTQYCTAALIVLRETIVPSNYEFMNLFGPQLYTSLNTILNRMNEPLCVYESAWFCYAELVGTASKWPLLAKAIYNSSSNHSTSLSPHENCSLSSTLPRFMKMLETHKVITPLYLMVIHRLLVAFRKQGLAPPSSRLVRFFLNQIDVAQFGTTYLPNNQSKNIVKISISSIPLLLHTRSDWQAFIEQLLHGIHILLHNLGMGDANKNDQLDEQVSENDQMISLDNAKCWIVEEWHLKPDCSSILISSKMASRYVGLLKSLIACLIACLNEPQSYMVFISWPHFLSIFNQLLAFGDSSSKIRETFQNYTAMTSSLMMETLPHIHNYAYLLLQSTIRILNTSIFPYTPQIVELLIRQMISQRQPNGQYHSGSNQLVLPAFVYYQQYKTIQSALQLLGTSSIALATCAASYAIQDMKTSAVQCSQTHEESVQLAACQTLETCLYTVGTQLSSEQRSQIDLLIVSIFFPYHLQHTPSVWHSPQLRCDNDNSQLTLALKTNSVIRLALYRTLLASVLSSSVSQASTLAYARRFFAAGSLDPTTDIGVFCMHAITVCNHLTHPRIPCLPPTSSILSNLPKSTLLLEDFQQSRISFSSNKIPEFTQELKISTLQEMDRSHLNASIETLNKSCLSISNDQTDKSTSLYSAYAHPFSDNNILSHETIAAEAKRKCWDQRVNDVQDNNNRGNGFLREALDPTSSLTTETDLFHIQDSDPDSMSS